MSNIVLISNVRGYVDTDGKAFLNAEDVARGWGFTQTAKSGNTVVRWERVNNYLQEFGFIPTSGDGVGKDDYLPENIVYRLGFKASNETAQKFQAKLADEILPQIRKTGSYIATPNFSNPAEAARAWADQYERKQLAEAKAKELEAELDESKEWYTIKRVAKNNGIEWKTISWRDLKKASIAMGVRKIFDANYGNVNAYHITAWRAVYPSFKYN